MRKNKEDLVAELEKLTMELEEMEIIFRFDGVIDDKEQAEMDKVLKEINALKTDIQKIEELSNLLKIDRTIFEEQERLARVWLEENYKVGMTTEEVLLILKKEFQLLMTDEMIMEMINEVAISKGIKNGLNPLPENGSLSDITKFHFNWDGVILDLDIASEFKLMLPAPLCTGRIEFEITGAYSGDFSVAIRLNGIDHFNIQSITKYSISDNTLRTGLQYSSKEKVCTKANPETVKKAIIAKGEALKKTMDTLSSGQGTITDKKDVVSAIADMYSEIEKLTAACSEVDKFSIGSEVVIPFEEGEDAYPSVNFTFTLHF